MVDFLKQLNDSQRDAVTQIDGPVMVIAGAGSGKTRVLTYRIAFLLSKNVDPFNILALTFTNKAAREMKERIALLVGEGKARSLWMGTFHSIFAKILRIESEKLGFPSNFTIYDTDDSKRLLKSIIKEQSLDDKTYQPGYVLGRISNAKNNLIGAREYNEDYEIQSADAAARKPKLGLIYSLYQQRLIKASAMDFDDLLFNTNILLRDHVDVLYKYQQKFHYILVDEYQDTNYSQYLIVKKLAANNENLCVVGDDAQSIYSFRGANIQNILNFKKDYPDYKVYKLEQNYRSTQTIVNAANSLIEHNKDQIKKNVWTDNQIGEKIRVHKAQSDSEEANYVANSIFETISNTHCQHKDFAVLYRTNAQSRSMEEALRRNNIPYRIFGGVSFYQRKEIKDVLAYFRLAINKNDEEALLRIINYPARGIGQTTIDKLVVAANDNKTSLWAVVEDPGRFGVNIQSGARNRIFEFQMMVKSFGAQLDKKNAFDLAKYIASTSGILKALFEDQSPEGVSRRENIDELLNGINEFCERFEEQNQDPSIMPSLDIFMQDIALMTDADQTEKDPNDINKVSLMTIHSAKGLEFPYVFIVGVEENLFPSQMSIGSRAELEEERRLFYVALTRAMTKVSVSYAETRFKYGSLNFCDPSRFIDEIDKSYIEQSSRSGLPGVNEPLAQGGGLSGFQLNTGMKKSIQAKPLSPAKAPIAGQTEEGFDILNPKLLSIGTKVEHQRFGTGQVIELEIKGDNSKAVVDFNGIGAKNLLLKFARLKIID